MNTTTVLLGLGLRVRKKLIASLILFSKQHTYNNWF